MACKEWEQTPGFECKSGETVKGTDCEKELRSNWECGTDYLNQEVDLGQRGKEEGEVYAINQCNCGACWGGQVKADNLMGRKRNLDWALR